MPEKSVDHWSAIICAPDADSIEPLGRQLSALGLEVVAAACPADVATALRDRGRALVLTAMPDGPDGLRDACRHWRELAKQCHVAVLLKRYDSGGIERAYEQGADDVMIEPVSPAELRTRVSRALEMLDLEAWREQLTAEAVLISEISTSARLHSRRYLQAQLGHEIDRARRFAHGVAVILAQVTTATPDERLLRTFGVFLNRCLRVNVDWVARYEDRTFALVLPETTLLGAVRTAHRLRGAMSQTTLAAAGLPADLTASFGVSALDEVSAMDLPDTQTLMESAEAYLREAVQDGPDRIIGGRAQLTH